MSWRCWEMASWAGGHREGAVGVRHEADLVQTWQANCWITIYKSQSCSAAMLSRVLRAAWDCTRSSDSETQNVCLTARA